MLFHISVDYPDLSVARVAGRVGEGGHDEPEEKIRARYVRNGALIRQAALISDIAHVFDNSKLNQPPKRMLTFTRGSLGFVFPHLPGWVRSVYQADLDNLM